MLTVTLLLIGVSLSSYWVGAQRAAEEWYVRECIDRKTATEETRRLTTVQIGACVAACVAGFALHDLLWVNSVVTVNICTASGCILMSAACAAMLNTLVFFREIPQESRKIYQELKLAKNKQDKKEEHIQQLVE